MLTFLWLNSFINIRIQTMHLILIEEKQFSRSVVASAGNAQAFLCD